MTDKGILNGIEGLDEDDKVKPATVNKGRVTINSEHREKLDMKEGQNVLMWIDDKEEQTIGIKIIDEQLLKEMLQ